MATAGRTELRLALAVLLTAVIPLIVAIYFANTLVDRAFAQAFTPELGEHLDRSLEVYQDLAKSLKEGMRHQADAMASHAPLRSAAVAGDEKLVRDELETLFSRHPSLASLSIVAGSGRLLASRQRATPVDPAREMKLELTRPLGEGERAPELVSVFVAPRARFDELQRASDFVRAYHQIERVHVKLKRGDLYAFAAILAVTILVAVALGTLLARSVTTRIAALAAATNAVAAGDLSVRVPERGNDELTDLSRNFNRMLSEVQASRARIEFLQRMSSWQEMARRLAHEIKNPLTPIVLAVEECHRKYRGDDLAFRKLLDVTLEIVEDEVGTLRRLVGEFSSFARLPRAEPTAGDLADFLRDERAHAALLLEGREPLGSSTNEADTQERAAPAREQPIRVTFRIPDTPMPSALDRQMLHRVLSNVVRNAVQAITAHKGEGQIEIAAEPDGEGYALLVDDDGPGVPESMRLTVFDPYVTNKSDGTGLGLAIVKKIIVEHGGTIDVATSPLGGARFRIRIPSLSSAAANALLELTGPSSLPGSRGP